MLELAQNSEFDAMHYFISSFKIIQKNYIHKHAYFAVY